MLNVREEPMACVFYQINLLPKISLDFFFSDAVWEINDKHSWKAVNVCIRHVFSSRVDKRSSDSSAAYLLCYLECFLNLLPPRINNNGINNNTNLMVTLQRIYEILYMKCKIVPWTYHIL